MELSSEAIIAIIGVAVNIPAAAIILWRVCSRVSSKRASANHSAAPAEPTTQVEAVIGLTTATSSDAQAPFASEGVGVPVKSTTEVAQQSTSEAIASSTTNSDAHPEFTTSPSND
ncbi:hypothetical protein BFJ66_g16100 [Fusarium oxysporum f. sp. cepae]|uniref:Uncharacterized protein n=1 Tax=Fusarium oxysporum f. sp. cepae TaxID=396571 RepID=A0A3L6NVN6_FUSOX|nr:hypothetical protein BFJ65_g5387 [Fusarium oxysporum f. sp. cepae]RKK30891.1 hypothetical protein BFJ66_g16100 [Fusarium oxysporum f. sp. cepae]RKK48435.1 hypothetical protein BFJ67_g7357 [Fusarium oxysporum f. sp. cepae]